MIIVHTNLCTKILCFIYCLYKFYFTITCNTYLFKTGTFDTWEDAYNQLCNDCSGFEVPLIPQPEDDGLEPVEGDLEHNLDEWMNRAGQGPNNAVRSTEPGRRDLDLQHDWQSAEHQYGEVQEITTFVQKSKDSHHLLPIETPDAVLHDLTEKQLQVE